MQEVCRGGGGKDTSFDGFGFYLSHGFLYCRVQGLAEVNTKVFDMFWSFYTHGVETLNHLCRCVDAQGSCFGDVDVEATDFSIFTLTGRSANGGAITRNDLRFPMETLSLYYQQCRDTQNPLGYRRNMQTPFCESVASLRLSMNLVFTPA